MVHMNAGRSVFVKEYDFFVSQGGLTQEWGKSWQQVYADSIEHARLKGEVIFRQRIQGIKVNGL